MLKDIEKLFGSAARVRLMRYFLAHKDATVAVEDLPGITKVPRAAITKELALLKKLKFLEEMVIEEFYEGKKKPKVKSAVKLNRSFNYNDSLETVMLDFRFVDQKEIVESIKNHGKIKLLVLGGIFTKDEKSKLDMLVVGDSIDKNGTERVIKNIEAEMGTELVYSVFDTDEFRYRIEMFDRFLKDFLKGDVITLVEKISTRV
jgi:hypothetical protein